MNLVKHSLWQEHPGRVYLDIWGWYANLHYQRSMFDNVSADLDYFKKRVIEESYRWGANYLYVNLHPHGNGLPFPWADDDPIKRPKGYLYIKNEKWNDKTFHDLLEYTHKHRMLICWAPQQDSIPGLDEGILRDRSNEDLEPYKEKARKWTNFFDGGTYIIFNKDRIKENLDFISKLYRDFADSLKANWTKTADCFKYEHWFIDKKGETVNRLWEYNPGMVIIADHGHDFPLISPTGVYSVCGGSIGFDEASCRSVYDNHLYDKFPQIKKLYIEFQANSRPFANNIFGGGAYPDMFLKQCNDFFRHKLYHPDDRVSPSSIFWINEADNIVWDGLREYVYAVSQDPIKAAFTTKLTTTGSDGFLSKKSNRQIYKYPATTNFIQNNYLRLYITGVSHVADTAFDQEPQGGELIYDPERLAHYDSDSKSISLTGEFIKTSSESELEEIRKDTDCFVEFGGQKAVMREKMFAYIGNSWIRESRTYTVINDTPYLLVSLNRTVDPKPKDIETTIGCEGYDKMIADGAEYTLSDKKIMIGASPKIIHFQDTKKIKPDLIFFILDKGNVSQVEWAPKGKLIFSSQKVRQETIKLAIVVPTDLYQEKELPILKEFLGEKELSLKLKEDKGEVNNKHSIPLVKVLKVTNPNLGPYFIEEYGWWMFRGAQPSEQDNKKTDYVKVYLKANGKAKLQQKEYIDDILKPGWGCQYIMAIKDIKGDNQRSSCTVKVFSVTPLIFAPRIEFKKKIVTAKVNGKPWHYFEENILFFPNKEGIYKVEANHKGEKAPHLRRTFAHVEETKWKDNIFEFKAKLPIYVESMPKELPFTAVIDLGKRKVKKLEGAEIMRESSQGIMVKFKPGKVRIFTTE